MYNTVGDYILVVCPNPSIDILALLDGIKEAETNRIREEYYYPGGKGVHVALSAAEMGEKIVLLGFWGGATGRWVKDTCEKMHQNIRCVGPELHGMTRSCYTFKSDGLLNDTEILGVGPSLTSSDIDLFYGMFENQVAGAKCVALCGSWPKEAPEEGYKKLIEIAHDYEKAIFLDCTGIQFTNAITQKPFMVHLNRAELTTIFNTEDFDKAINMLALECTYAAVTDGAKGLYLTSGNEMLHASCKIEKVYSAVGSGDSLVAGLVIAYVRGYDLTETARLATACGAANCSNKELGLLKKADIDNLKLKTQVEILNNIAEHEV